MREANAFRLSLTAAVVCLFSLAPSAHAVVRAVEEFDDYADDAALRAEWVTAHGKDAVFVKVPGTGRTPKR